MTFKEAMKLALRHTEVEARFKGKQAYVNLVPILSGSPILELSGKAVSEAVDEIGILGPDPRDWHRSMLDYAFDVDLIPDRALEIWQSEEGR